MYFKNIIGQDKIKKNIDEMYESMYVPHCQLFIDKNGNSTECDGGVPRRLLYPELEKKTNSNVPPGDSIFDRVENDPS